MAAGLFHSSLHTTDQTHKIKQLCLPTICLWLLPFYLPRGNHHHFLSLPCSFSGSEQV